MEERAAIRLLQDEYNQLKQAEDTMAICNFCKWLEESEEHRNLILGYVRFTYINSVREIRIRPHNTAKELIDWPGANDNIVAHTLRLPDYCLDDLTTFLDRVREQIQNQKKENALAIVEPSEPQFPVRVTQIFDNNTKELHENFDNGLKELQEEPTNDPLLRP